LDYSRWPKED
jgi:hypothetical protein